ncbi:hypothetical protein EMGR_001227 [Emarellia grisea]
MGELVAAQVLPDVLDGIELRRVGRQDHNGNRVGNDEGITLVPAGAVHDQDGVSPRCHGAGDLDQMRVQTLGVGARHHQARAHAASRADGAEQASVPFWPIRASSWNQISIGLALAASGITCATCAAKVF